ncbi:MAG TPA: OB-fold domain-containing protein [Acidimicrobiales bacterium]|nr:OB-fold domain-containing protein [Acidimicrobiales bacterium]
MSTPGLFVPQPEGLSLAFHHAAIEGGRLHVQRCSDCGRFRHPPRVHCPECFSPTWTFEPSTERGTVYSYVVSHRSFDPAWVERIPFVTLAVALDEGPRVIAALERGGADVALGTPVAVRIEVQSPDFTFLWATPAD